ncbi:MAG: LacI family DNA-binding transcriptional regulator [Gaiellaceae bacterium]
MARLTIKDVAEHADVSLGTVSNVLNKPELVAEPTRQRVLAAIDALGFVRNNAARQLRGIRNASIALVVLDFDNPFFTEVARGVERAAAEAEHLVVLASSGAVAAREDEALRLLEEQRVAGILISPASSLPPRRLREIRAHGLPVVLLDRHRKRADQCSVAVDDTSGGRQVGRHLLELGHDRIGLINGPRQLKPCAERRDGLLHVLAGGGHGIARGDDIEMDVMTIEAGEAAMNELIGRNDMPSAVFCGNDLMAIGAERAALASGLRIPQDVAVVGYDDIRFAATSLVPLTSVHNPAYELGYVAATLLIEEATTGETHRHRNVLLKPELVVRASTVATP